MIANMDGSRFRRPKNADEEAAWLRETTPQNTRNSTKWSLKIFEGLQGSINLMKFIQNTNRLINILYQNKTGTQKRQTNKCFFLISDRCSVST